MNHCEDLYVVGIGASVGGLDALKQLFEHLPCDTGMAFVIVQHLSPDYKSLMPELLAKHTAMNIYPAENNQVLQPNCIYLNQSKVNLVIKKNIFNVCEANQRLGFNLPIDFFFKSLGEEYREKSLGIILSGTGSDGVAGIKTIKELGGTILAQEPGSAQFDGMPNAAISTNMVDFILDPAGIAQTIMMLARPHFKLKLSDNQDDDANTNEELYAKILSEIHRATGIDFKDYKRNTLVRRLEKRLHINGIDNLNDYLAFLRNSQEEKEVLMQDFLIGVTCFFRDVEAFNVLKEAVIPGICRSKAENELVRIWIAGCSTGEEVFSIAILFDEYITNNKLNIDYKIFATDVDAKAISKASSGVYHPNIVNEMDEEYAARYFVNMGNRMGIVKSVREKIVFSTHNILKDPPFVRVDLVSCRNLLIYLDSKIQKKVLLNFQFALNKNGYLFLGNSESMGENKKYFEQVNSKWKIYKNISDTKPLTTQHSIINKISIVPHQSANRKMDISDIKPKENQESVFHRFLSNRYSPSCVFIDKNFNILFIKGQAGKRLIHSEGLFERNLLKVVDPDIASVIRNGINRLDVEKREVTYKDVMYTSGGDHFTYDISFYHPDNKELNEMYVIEFGEDRKLSDNNILILNNIQTDNYSKQRIAFLEDELKSVKNELQNVIEELETSNEELQSSNEELMSSNEELQSANEELYTVNSEFLEKNKELVDLNNDINNLLNSTDIGTLFLDNNLKIRKFTPTLQKHFKLQETDIGRPITSFASNFNEDVRDSIISDSKTALDALLVIEKEIVDNENNHYLRRISPFVTSDKKINGVVITFVDVNQLKKAKEEITIINQRLELANIVSENAIWELDYNTNNIITANKIWDDIYGLDHENTTSQWNMCINEDEREKIWRSINDHFTGKTEKYLHEFRFRNPTTGVERWVSDVGKVVEYNKDGSPAKLLGVSIDITKRKKAELELLEANKKIEESERNFKIVATSTPDHILVQDLALRYTMVVNPQIGLTTDDMIGKTDFDLLQHDDALKLTELKKKVINEGETISQEVCLGNKMGEKSWFSGSYVPKKNADGQIIGLVGYFKNITEHKQMEADILAAKEKAERNEKKYKNLFTSLQEGVYLHEVVYDHDGKPTNYIITDANPISETYLGIKLEDAVGKLATELYQTPEAPFLDVYAKVAETGDPIMFDHYFEPMQKHFLISVFSPSKGQFATTFLDITSSKKYEKELLEAKEKAEESDRFKTAFLQNISHEIRTPLNAIMGFSNLITKNYNNREKLETFASIIVRRSGDLLDIINDIIDISKIESGQLPMNIEKCHLNELFCELKGIVTELQKGINKTQISIKAEIAAEVNQLTIEVDKGKLRQIFINLLSNALKYTEKGSVLYGCHIANQQLVFFVHDTGIGFSSDKNDLIFQRFVRLEETKDSTIGGTGLGLSIVKGLVDLLGGKVWVESEPGVGSKFYFSISYVQADHLPLAETVIAADMECDCSNKTIMIVEDDRWNAGYLKEILSQTTSGGILQAETGKRAIELARENHIDMVLMDVRLPDMTGYEVIAELQKIHPAYKIILQTAYASHDERTKALSHGCVDYVSKPIKEQVLLDSIKLHLNL